MFAYIVLLQMSTLVQTDTSVSLSQYVSALLAFFVSTMFYKVAQQINLLLWIFSQQEVSHMWRTLVANHVAH